MEQLFHSSPDIIQTLMGLVQFIIDSMGGNLLDLHVVTDPPGFDALSDHMIRLNKTLKDVGINSADTLMGAAKALGAIFSLVVAAQKAYKMMTLDGKFEVLEIARPILFAFLIANSGAIVQAVTAPGQVLEDHFRDVYINRSAMIDNLREQRGDVSGTFRQMITEKSEAAEEVKKSWYENAWDTVTDAWDKVANLNTTVSSLIWGKIFGWVDMILVFLGEVFFQIAVYFIFFIKALFITVLTLFGPIQLACSILPVWKDSWATWIGRLVSVSLYGAMAYLVMIYSLAILEFAYQADISQLQGIADGTAAAGVGTVWNYVTSLLSSSCLVFIAYLCGTLAMSTVPEMASWCIPGGSASMGAANFVGGMISRAESGTRKMTRV